MENSFENKEQREESSKSEEETTHPTQTKNAFQERLEKSLAAGQISQAEYEEMLANVNKKNTQKIEDSLTKNLKISLEAGEITPAEYQSLTSLPHMPQEKTFSFPLRGIYQENGIPSEILNRIKGGWIAASISASLTLIFVLIGFIFPDTNNPLFDAENLFDAIFVGIIAIGIYHKSFIAALLMLLYFVISKVYLWLGAEIEQNIFIVILFLWLYTRAIIGTSQYQTFCENNLKPIQDLENSPPQDHLEIIERPTLFQMIQLWWSLFWRVVLFTVLASFFILLFFKKATLVRSYGLTSNQATGLITMLFLFLMFIALVFALKSVIGKKYSKFQPVFLHPLFELPKKKYKKKRGPHAIIFFLSAIVLYQKNIMPLIFAPHSLLNLLHILFAFFTALVAMEIGIRLDSKYKGYLNYHDYRDLLLYPEAVIQKTKWIQTFKLSLSFAWRYMLFFIVFLICLVYLERKMVLAKFDHSFMISFHFFCLFSFKALWSAVVLRLIMRTQYKDFQFALIRPRQSYFS